MTSIHLSTCANVFLSAGLRTGLAFGFGGAVMVSVSDMTHPLFDWQSPPKVPFCQKNGAIAGKTVPYKSPLRLTIRSTKPPYPHVKRAFSSVTDVSVLKPDDKWAEFRERKPHRHLPLEHAALAAGIALPLSIPLSGDHKRDASPVRLGALQKAKKRRISLLLRVSVQIDPGVNWIAAAGYALSEAPA